jgi:hypothetical protein
VIAYLSVALSLAAEPTTVPTTVPAASAPAPEAAPATEPPPLTTEQRQRLQDFRFKTLTVEPSPDSFRVHDGLGATLGVSSFAKTTNDSDTLAHLARDRKRANDHKKALVYSGVALVLASATTLAVGLPGQEPEVREDIAYTALFLGLSGGLLWWIAPMAVEAKTSPPIDEYYTRTEAESRADAYNDALRTRLDIDAIPQQPADAP